MVNRILIVGVMLSASLAFGQLDSNSVTVSATRNTYVQPDQAVISVRVDSGTTSSFNDVLAAMQSVGITAANFAGVGSPQGIGFVLPGDRPPSPPAPTLEWIFGLPVPISKITDTLAALTKLQGTIGQQRNGLTLTFNVQGTQASPQLLQSQTCSMPDLISDARAQAQKLADAAGMTLGPILAMSSATSGVGGSTPIPISPYVLTSPLSFPPICSATVKFGVTRY